MPKAATELQGAWFIHLFIALPSPLTKATSNSSASTGTPKMADKANTLGSFLSLLINSSRIDFALCQSPLSIKQSAAAMRGLTPVGSTLTNFIVPTLVLRRASSEPRQRNHRELGYLRESRSLVKKSVLGLGFQPRIICIWCCRLLIQLLFSQSQKSSSVTLPVNRSNHSQTNANRLWLVITFWLLQAK